MVFGIGIDIIKIDRIQKSIERFGNQFLNKVFTQIEINYASSKGSPYQHYAVRFAAKEAIAKALSTSSNKGFQWKEIEIYNEDNGLPKVNLYGKVRDILGDDKSLKISLSHSDNLATCVAIVYNKL